MPQVRILHSIARLLGQVVCVLAACILAAWAVHSGSSEYAAELLGLRPMFVGLVLMLSGFSLCLQYRGNHIGPARACAAGGLAFALADLARVLLLESPGVGSSQPHGGLAGSVGLMIAAGGIAASVSLLFLQAGDASRRTRPPLLLATAIAALAVAALVSQWLKFGAGALVAGQDTEANCAAVGLLLLAYGIIFARPPEPLPRIVNAPGAEGAMSSRLLIVVFLSPAILALALPMLEHTRFAGISAGAALLNAAYIVAGLVIAMFSAETVIGLAKKSQHIDQMRESLTARLLEQAAELQETVESRTRELRQVNLNLATLNERLQLAINSSNQGVWERDLASDKLVWDDRMHEIYGVPKEGFTGHRSNWSGRLHPDDAEEAKRAADTVIAGGADAYVSVYRIVHPDGSLRYVEAHGYVHRDADGRPIRLAGLNRDITAERELRDALQLAEQRSRLAIEGTNDAVWDWNIETGHVLHDARWSNMLGYEEAEVLPSHGSWRNLVHPDDMASTEAPLKAHIEGRSPFYQHEYRMRAKNGEWVWILGRGKVVSRGVDGRALRMVGTHTDITHRKNMEQRLRRTEELAERVSRIASIGGWEMDLATSRLTWSSGVKRIFGMAESVEPSLSSALEHFPFEARETLQAALLDASTEGRPIDLELPLEPANGRRAWVRIQGVTEMRDGRPARIFGAVQDITEAHESENARRQLEMQLFNAQKMETLGTFAGGIAHDFNNLLTGIIGYLELAAESVPEDHPARACLAESRNASLRARELVEQILTFGRQSSSEGQESADPSLVIEEARRFLRSTLPANITITSTIDPACGHVVADISQMHQVLLNLGSNAAHAMSAHGGTLGISLEKVEITSDFGAILGGLPAGAYVRLSVSDTGHGMDEATMQRIFDPFFTTKNIREGNGLGLAVVHGIVRAHRGAINVESKVGAGSAFHIYLPAAAEKRPPVTSDFTQAPRGAGELVCIVDDEDIVMRSTKVALERKGYRVATFHTAEECLVRLGDLADACRVLITDQTMPGMQGTELAAAAQALIPGLPVVIMSGYFSKIPAQALDQLGQVKLLAKPFTGNELAFTVHEALHPERALS